MAINLFFLINHILSVLLMGLLPSHGSPAPLPAATLLLIDLAYISACNVKKNKAVTLFCALLALDGWYILLSPQTGRAPSFAFAALSPVMLSASIAFVLLFLFQDSGYKFKRGTHLLLLFTCAASLAGLCVSDRMFACMYGIQFLIGLGCFLFIVICHRKRVLFVLKSEWKCFSFSFAAVTAVFILYYFSTRHLTGHLSNFGIYLPVMLFFLSIHGIIRKAHNSFPLSAVFSKKQLGLLFAVSIALLLMAALVTNAGYREVFVYLNSGAVIVSLCSILLESGLKQGNSGLARHGKYLSALHSLRQEEALKTEFANFLHDEVLQDLLSVKNLMIKSERPEIQSLIVETLNELNNVIRSKMQDCYPVVLKNLTARENYQNVIEAVSLSFPHREITVSFSCSDLFFPAEPLDVLLCRMLKELLTNVYKHSDGDQAWVALAQKGQIIELRVSDNGTADAELVRRADRQSHKGLASIEEQADGMGGEMRIHNISPRGLCISIVFPMKGDVSYQYFVS